MVVRKPLRCIEEDSAGVGEASGKNPEQSRELHMEPKKTNGKQCHPSHAEVGQNRDSLMLQPAKHFERYAEYRQTPDHTKKYPTPDATHRPKCERRISAGDENVNRRMIKQMEEPFDSTPRYCVIDRRCKIERNHRHCENDGASQTKFAL